MSIRPIAIFALAALAAGCAGGARVEAPAAPQAAARPPADFPTTPPALGPAPAVTLPAPVSRSLPNGLTVIYVRHGELPIVHATLVTRGGMGDDPANLPGLASFTAEMLDEGAGGRNALELAAALDALGASLSTGAAWDAAQADLEVLRARLPEALALMADVVFRPDFPAADVQRIREQRLTNIARARDEAGIIAGNAFASLVFGERHVYGRVPTTESTRRIDRAALANFHQQFYRPGSSTLLLVGDVDADELHPVVERTFGSWRAGRAPAAAAPTAPAATPTAIYLIDKPEAAQSEIRIGHPAVGRDSPDFFPLTVLNTLLGGSFTSRLNMNLREQHGYAYGAGSSFAMRLGPGPFLASSAVVTAKTDSAVIQFFHELNRIRDEEVPQDELERAKNYIALGLPRGFETAGQVAARLTELVVYGLDLDYYNGYVQQIMAVTPQEVRRVADRYVRPGQSAVVIVGDRATVEEGLRALPVGTVQIRRLEEFVR
jgi:predicted Zn-dependent peptidase